MSATATERVAQLREEAERAGTPVDHLSDLDVLYEHMKLRERERTDANDRYMGVLTTLRKHDQAVRAAVVADMRTRVDEIAAGAVGRLHHDITQILRAVEVLPETANRERVTRLKEIAHNARHMLSLAADAPDAARWRLNDNDARVNAVNMVVGVLGDRDGIPADEVIRLVKEALQPNGNLLDLFDVADTGTLKPHLRPQEPPFVAGEHWHSHASHYTYEPADTRARIVAYDIGDAWHLDLWSDTGALLAYGTTTADHVAALAPALTDRAAAWTRDRNLDGRPWQRFSDLTDQLQQAT